MKGTKVQSPFSARELPNTYPPDTSILDIYRSVNSNILFVAGICRHKWVLTD